MKKKRGEVIVRSKPFVHILLQNERGNRCDLCFNSSGKLQRCSGCGILRYCNIDCQKHDWSLHKLECQCFKQVLPNIPNDSLRLFLRILLRYQQGDDDKINGSPGWHRSFRALQSHTEELRNDRVRSDQFSNYFCPFLQLMGNAVQLPPRERLFEMFGKMVINCFTIHDGELQPIGSGIYLSPSLLDHSCSPNAVVTFHGRDLELRALKELPSVEPSKIFISYIDQLSPSRERRKELRERYYFDCVCEKCCNEDLDQLMTSLKCPRNHCPGVLFQTREGKLLPCKNCQWDRFTEAFTNKVTHIVEYSRETLKKIKEMQHEQDKKQEALALCEECLTKQESMLHDLNIYRLWVLDLAFDVCINLQEWEKALEYGCRTLEPYRTFYPSFSPNIGIQLMKVGKLQLYLQKPAEARKILQEAETIVRVTHGADHSLFKQLAELSNQCFAAY